MDNNDQSFLDGSCLIFPFSRVNANAISALLASLDIHETLNHLEVYLPDLEVDPRTFQNRESKYNKILQYSKVIVAFSVYTTQLQEISSLIEYYKEVFSETNLLIVAGGPHPIGDPFSMLYHGADIVCTGEGEVVFREIILKYLKKEALTDISGTAFFKDKTTLVKMRKPDPIDLSKFPPFSIKHKLVRPIEITRGCAWKCRFCQIRSKGIPVRHRSVDQILEYIEYTIDHFSERRPDIRFVSPNALSYGAKDGKTVNLVAVENLLSSIRNLIGTEGKIYFGSFPSELRPETISKESVDLLKRYSNVTRLIIGGQSGSNTLLEKSSRGHNVAEVERAVKLLVDAGFSVSVDIIFGLPEETEEDVKMTIHHMEYLVEIGATIHSHTFLPLVGTPFASKSAGTIHPLYHDFIEQMRSRGKLKGQHQRQAKQAKIMEETREKELDHRKYEFEVIKK